MVELPAFPSPPAPAIPGNNANAASQTPWRVETFFALFPGVVSRNVAHAKTRMGFKLSHISVQPAALSSRAWASRPAI
jgi:hypothetical protein